MLKVSLASRAALVAGIFVVSACSNAVTNEPSSIPASPSMFPAQPLGTDITFQWIETPEFDPLSPDATFVRAYVESYEHARNGQSTDWGYPGFLEASPPNIDEMLEGDELGLSFIGTFFYRLLRLRSDVSSTTFILCRYGFASFKKKNSGWEYGSWPPRPVTIIVDRDGLPPPANKRGPERTPHGNVFRGWKVADFDFFSPDAEGNLFTPERRECETDIRGLPTMPADVVQQLEPEAPLRPSPGWPGTDL